MNPTAWDLAFISLDGKVFGLNIKVIRACFLATNFITKDGTAYSDFISNISVSNKTPNIAIIEAIIAISDLQNTKLLTQDVELITPDILINIVSQIVHKSIDEAVESDVDALYEYIGNNSENYREKYEYEYYQKLAIKYDGVNTYKSCFIKNEINDYDSIINIETTTASDCWTDNIILENHRDNVSLSKIRTSLVETAGAQHDNMTSRSKKKIKHKK